MHGKIRLIELNAKRDTYADLFYDQRRCIYRICMSPLQTRRITMQTKTYIQPYLRACFFAHARMTRSTWFWTICSNDATMTCTKQAQLDSRKIRANDMCQTNGGRELRVQLLQHNTTHPAHFPDLRQTIDQISTFEIALCAQLRAPEHYAEM